jgi:hypothetical protein
MSHVKGAGQVIKVADAVVTADQQDGNSWNAGVEGAGSRRCLRRQGAEGLVLRSMQASAAHARENNRQGRSRDPGCRVG